jgi:hypothetical protein
MSNRDTFVAALTAAYVRLFETPDYAYAAARTTPEALAVKMTDGLASGRANKAGEGIQAACKAVGVRHTYTAIRAYLTA